MAKVRGVRFTDQEEALIAEFISNNPFFDFSTLAKLAILEFIRKTEISLKPVKTDLRKEQTDVRP